MLKRPRLLKVLSILLAAVALQVASYGVHPALAAGGDVARVVLLVGALAFLLSALPGTQRKLVEARNPRTPYHRKAAR